ncbi:hypothetical protein BJY01DRAFT_221404 [Aspergillus pseudoustus]|uniref:Uncharacterized protein n=1 Tax=Aspergillus pseudoustus TaxID=1810923 RepID=A0ABR4JAD3_9EURO
MSYCVYTAEYIGSPNHEAIYIETDPMAAESADRGRRYHVTGTILQGMVYESKGSLDPDHEATHVPGTKKRIGTVAIGDLTRFEEECCRAVPPPRPQVTLGGKRLYSGTPLYRCGDWMRDVLVLAFEKGIFRAG